MWCHSRCYVSEPQLAGSRPLSAHLIAGYFGHYIGSYICHSGYIGLGRLIWLSSPLRLINPDYSAGQGLLATQLPPTANEASGPRQESSSWIVLPKSLAFSDVPTASKYIFMVTFVQAPRVALVSMVIPEISISASPRHNNIAIEAAADHWGLWSASVSSLVDGRVNTMCKCLCICAFF